MSERLIKQSELRKFFTDTTYDTGIKRTGDLKVKPYIAPKWLLKEKEKERCNDN